MFYYYYCSKNSIIIMGFVVLLHFSVVKNLPSAL